MMKKYGWLAIAALLSAGFVSACDDDDSSASKAKNGEPCNAASECESQYCDANHFCAAPKLANGAVCNGANECLSQYCGADHYCADRPTALLENGAQCTKSSECKSDFCNDQSVCADKSSTQSLLANGDACERNDQCASKICESKKCVAQATPVTGPKEIGDPCNDHGDCGFGMFCNNYACDVITNMKGTACSAGSLGQCIGGALVTCLSWTDASYFYDVKVCGDNEKCVVVNENAACAEACTEADVDKEYTTCDPENTDEEGWSMGVLIHKCVKVNNDYVYAVVDWKNCDYGQWCGKTNNCE